MVLEKPRVYFCFGLECLSGDKQKSPEIDLVTMKARNRTHAVPVPMSAIRKFRRSAEMLGCRRYPEICFRSQWL